MNPQDKEECRCEVSTFPGIEDTSNCKLHTVNILKDNPTPHQDLQEQKLKTHFTCIHSHEHDFSCGKCVENLIKSRDAKMIEEIEKSRKKATKHEGCVLDDCYCYTHAENMKEEDFPNGSEDFNRGLDTAISIINTNK